MFTVNQNGFLQYGHIYIYIYICIYIYTHTQKPRYGMEGPGFEIR